MTHTITAVILDWDGTLADSHTSLYEANVEVMRAFDLPFTPEIYREHYSPNWRLMYLRLGVPEVAIDDANAIWEAAYHGTRTTTLLPGARQALLDLAAAGLPLALVTAGSRSVVQPQIDRLGLADLLPVRVYSDDLVAQKPDPAPLRRALDAIGRAGSPASVVSLGDAPDDVRMAIAAGVRPVGVVGPFSDRASLVAAGAVEVADSVAAWAAAFLATRSGAAAAMTVAP